jgi:hypothetical protein
MHGLCSRNMNENCSTITPVRSEKEDLYDTGGRELRILIQNQREIDLFVSLCTIPID